MDVHGRLRDPVAGNPRDQTVCARPRDVGHICFLTQKHIKLTLTGIVNCGSEKFSEQYSNLNNKN